MFCPKCGTENRDDAKFCMKCGFKLILDKEKRKEDTFNANMRSEVKKKWDYYLTIIVVIILVGGGGYIGLRFFSSIESGKKIQANISSSNMNKGVQKPEKIFSIHYEGLWGLVDEEFNIIYPVKYSNISNENNHFIASNYSDSISDLINEEGDLTRSLSGTGIRIIDDTHYSQVIETTPYQTGIYDFSGNEIVTIFGDARFYGDEYQLLLFFNEDKGEVTILSDDLKRQKNISAEAIGIQSGYVSRTDERYFSFCVDGKWGLMDEEGKRVIPPKYDYLSFPNENGVMGYVIDDNGGYLDISDKILFEKPIADGEMIWPVGKDHFISQINISTAEAHEFNVLSSEGKVLGTYDSGYNGVYLKSNVAYLYDGTKICDNVETIVPSETRVIIVTSDGRVKLFNKETGELLNEKDVNSVFN